MSPSFSNAAAVRSCLDKAKMEHQGRYREPGHPNQDEHRAGLPTKTTGSISDGILKPEDFDPDYKKKEAGFSNCRQLLQGCVAENIIQKLETFQRRAFIAKRRGKRLLQNVPTTFVFKGPPGMSLRCYWGHCSTSTPQITKHAGFD